MGDDTQNPHAGVDFLDNLTVATDGADFASCPMYPAEVI